MSIQFTCHTAIFVWRPKRHITFTALHWNCAVHFTVIQNLLHRLICLFSSSYYVIAWAKAFFAINPLTADWALRTLIDFTLSNARRFYSSGGNPFLDGKGLTFAGVPGEKPWVTCDKLPDSPSKFPCIHLWMTRRIWHCLKSHLRPYSTHPFICLRPVTSQSGHSLVVHPLLKEILDPSL